MIYSNLDNCYNLTWLGFVVRLNWLRNRTVIKILTADLVSTFLQLQCCADFSPKRRFKYNNNPYQNFLLNVLSSFHVDAICLDNEYI